MKYGYLVGLIACLWTGLLSPLHLYAQPEYDMFLIREVIPFGEAGFVTIFLDHPEHPKRMRLEFFTPDNASTFERVISLERQGVRAKYEGAFAWKGQLQILTSLYYPGPKRNHLIYQQFSVPDFADVRSIVVDEAYTPELYRVPFGYSLSPDSSKVMFYAWSYTLPKDPARVSITVLNPTLDTVWKQRYILPYKNESLYIYNCRLTDDGRAFLLCENYTGKIGPSVDENKIDYFVLGAQAGSENMIIYDLNPSGKTLRGLHIDPVPGNAMAGAAFYQEPGKGVHLGVYVFSIPPDGGNMRQELIPIDKEAYQAAYAFPGIDGMSNANRHRFESYEVQHVELLPDGGLAIIAEQEHYDETDGILEHNDIFILRIRPEYNRIQWMTRVPKRQSESFNENIFSPFSYKRLQHEGKWYFLYNDARVNYERGIGPRGLDNYWGDAEATIAAEVDLNGQVKWYQLSKLLRSKSIAKIWTGHCWDLGTGELLIFGGGANPVVGQNFLVGLSWEVLRSQPALQWKK